jgi:hypothetical protein
MERSETDTVSAQVCTSARCALDLQNARGSYQTYPLGNVLTARSRDAVVRSAGGAATARLGNRIGTNWAVQSTLLGAAGLIATSNAEDHAVTATPEARSTVTPTRSALEGARLPWLLEKALDLAARQPHPELEHASLRNRDEVPLAASRAEVHHEHSGIPMCRDAPTGRLVDDRDLSVLDTRSGKLVVQVGKAFGGRILCT